MMRTMLRIDHLPVPEPRPEYRACEDFEAERELCQACLAEDYDNCVHISSPRCVMRWFTRNKCGHGSLGRSWRCDGCGWSLCGPCFAKWPSRSGERVRRALNARPLWAPVLPYIGLGDCSLTPQIWVLRRDWEQRVTEGRCNGWWSEQNTRYVGKRCPLDIRFCGECSARLFSSAGPTRVQCANQGYTMLLRASRYTWPEEVALAECSEDPAVFKPPPARLTSCLSCASCPRTRFLHRAMVHVGDHHECHNGNTSRKQVCPCMSTTSWATFVLPRLVGHSTFLHVIFVPDSVFEEHAFDVSRPDLYEDSSCFRGEEHSLRKDLLYFGQINKEVVLDRAAASECAVKSFDAMQVEDLGRTASMGHKSNSCICCGSSIEAKLCAELATRMRLMQKLQCFLYSRVFPECF